MCGLVSVVTKLSNGFTKEQHEIFDALLYVDALRGMDSTGVFLVTNQNEMYLAKEASSANDYRSHAEYQRLLNKAFQQGRVLVGHNRAATKGKISDENAHPFVVDNNITLVHNGTLYGDHTKLAKVDVDSHAIAHVIHENSGDVEKAMASINGPYALIWHNYKEKTVNFLRNSMRPLHWVETDTAFLWASEANMLDWVISRFNLKPLAPVCPLKEDNLVTYSFDSGKPTIKNTEIKPPKVVPAYEQNWKGGNGYRGHTHGHHPYANGYYGVDEGEDWDPLTGFDMNPLSSKITQIHQHHKPIVNQMWIKDQEQLVAQKAGISISCTRFMNFSEDVKDEEYVAGICCDYNYVIEKTPSGGMFLYATMEKQPDFLIRALVPAECTEEQLLEWSLNGQRMLFKLKGKSWCGHTDKTEAKNPGDGFGIYTATSMRLLEDHLVETVIV